MLHISFGAFLWCDVDAVISNTNSRIGLHGSNSNSDPGLGQSIHLLHALESSSVNGDKMKPHT